MPLLLYLNQTDWHAAVANGSLCYEHDLLNKSYDFREGSPHADLFIITSTLCMHHKLELYAFTGICCHQSESLGK